jgi:heme a synthase
MDGPSSSARRSPFDTLTVAAFALGVNVLVVLQGAVVRATGSGAGCGSHWPTCNGAVVPMSGGVETTLEFSHRLLSLLALVAGAWLLRRALRSRAEQPGLAVFATAAFAFLVVEALLGALTVLSGLTGDTPSVARGLMVAVHLVNSLLLVGTLAGAYVYARRPAPAWPLRIGGQGGLGTVLLVGVVGMLVLMFSGGIAAMGNTMFPSASLVEGIAADFRPDSHPLVRLRILHPLIAVSVGVYLFVALGLAWWIKPVAEARATVRTLLGVYVLQLGVGTMNLALLAPIALQLLHLGLAVLAFGLLSVASVQMLGFPARRFAPARHAAMGERA